jgi:hypothetical protein
MIEDKNVPPHRHVVKKEPRKKEGCCIRQDKGRKVASTSTMSMFSYINTTLPNACTKMNLLYD